MASSAPFAPVIRFGPFELDLRNEELRKMGIPLKLHPQPFRVLHILVAHPGQIIERTEIQNALWGNHTFVDFEGGINFCIKQIRDALGDDAENPRYIETLPRRGYRFIASVSSSEPREQVIPFPQAPAQATALKNLEEFLDSAQETTALHIAPSPVSSFPKPLFSTFRIRAIVAATILLAALSGAALLYSRRPAKLTVRDTVVLADFRNATGDPIFDNAVKEALAVDLEQSPFLSILPDSRARQTLREMGRNSADSVNADLGHEICVRTGSKALLQGAISNFGQKYLVDLSAVACNTGEVLARKQEQISNKEDVLKAISKASSGLRVALGESLPSVKKFDTPMEATTTSLEALQNMSKAAQVAATEGDAASLPFVKHALELDPNFATAYVALARRYFNLGQPSLALENAAKAYALRDQVTEREKLEIEAMYFRTNGDLEKLTQVLEVWKADYPLATGPHGRLCNNQRKIGQYEKALEECREALRLDPYNVVNQGNMALTLLELNKLDDSRASLEQAQNYKINPTVLSQDFYSLAFLRGDSAEMARQLSLTLGKPGEEDSMLSIQSDTEAYYGRFNKAAEYSRRAMDSAVRSGLPETAALWRINEALRDAELGEVAKARRGVDEALQLAAGRDVKILASLALARTGDVPRARSLLVEVSQEYPSDTLLKIYWTPVINAAIEISQGRSGPALQALEAASLYDLAEPGSLYAPFLRGQAFLMANNGPAAAAEFQKLLDHRGIVLNSVTGALAPLQLARAYRLSGNTEKAKAAYADFLTQWKDADPANPLLAQARRESASLN